MNFISFPKKEKKKIEPGNDRIIEKKVKMFPR